MEVGANASSPSFSVLSHAANRSLASLHQQQPDIKLQYQTFSLFDRDVLLNCVKTLLLKSHSRDLVRGLIQQATTCRTTDWQQRYASINRTRWFNLSQLENYHELRNYASSSSSYHLQQHDQHHHPHRHNAPDELEVLDLHKLFNLLPSAEGDFDLAAFGPNWQIFLAVVYSLTAITSFLLNAITVIVLWKSPKSELRKYMINLSMSDLLMSCFSIPFTYTESMLGVWMFPNVLCPVGRFVVTLGVFVSIATMIVIGINRHSAIMNPLKGKKPTRIRVGKTHVIWGIWLLGIAISSPDYLMSEAKPLCFNKQLYFQCRQLWSNSIRNLYTILIYVSTFVIPLVLLSFLYIRIGFRLWNHKTPGNQNVSRDSTMQMQRTKVVNMLLVVVIVFIVSWLPIHTFSIINLPASDPHKTQEVDAASEAGSLTVAAYFACHWLSMAHSCLNPLIYGFMSKKFRRDLQNYVCGWMRLNPSGGGGGGFRNLGGAGQYDGRAACLRASSSRSPNVRANNFAIAVDQFIDETTTSNGNHHHRNSNHHHHHENHYRLRKQSAHDGTRQQLGKSDLDERQRVAARGIAPGTPPTVETTCGGGGGDDDDCFHQGLPAALLATTAYGVRAKWIARGLSSLDAQRWPARDNRAGQRLVLARARSAPTAKRHDESLVMVEYTKRHDKCTSHLRPASNADFRSRSKTMPASAKAAPGGAVELRTVAPGQACFDALRPGSARLGCAGTDTLLEVVEERDSDQEAECEGRPDRELNARNEPTSNCLGARLDGSQMIATWEHHDDNARSNGRAGPHLTSHNKDCIRTCDDGGGGGYRNSPADTTNV